MARIINLKLYDEQLRVGDYDSWKQNSLNFKTHSSNHKVDIAPLEKTIKKVMKNKIYNKDEASKASSDVVLAPEAHKTFKSLPNSLLTDNRFWQWVSLNLFFKYSEWRWNMTPQNIKDKPTLLRHVCSGRGIDGLSRNSISRLVIPCQDLVIKGNDYSLVKILFQNQQTEQSLAQSLQSMNPTVFKAMVKTVKGLSGDDVKTKIMRLNSLAVTYNLDAMKESEIINILK